MRIIFMGSPDFAVPALKALVEAPGHEVVAVYTQPPRESGRGKKVRRTPVHILAEQLNITVHSPDRLKNNSDALKVFEDLKADIAVVAAYGLILPQAILDAPKYGAINIHASLLPRWRGAAPIHRAIEAGDQQTGITLMQMDAGLDTGDMIEKDTVPITPQTTTGTLHDQLSALGAEMIVPVVNRLAKNGNLTSQAQDDTLATYAHKIDKAERAVDWSLSAQALERKVRAFDPWPSLWFSHQENRIKITAAEVVNVGEKRAGDPTEHRPGMVLDESLLIACGQGAVRLLGVQPAGKTAMPAKAFLNGYQVKVGEVLTA